MERLFEAIGHVHAGKRIEPRLFQRAVQGQIEIEPPARCTADLGKNGSCNRGQRVVAANR